MPFQETNRMEERVALLRAYESGAFSVSELCRRFGISRETFYVWKARRESGDVRWFEERSHAVSCCPHATDPAVGERLVAVRKRFPHYGPKKIRAWLDKREPELLLPSVSTIGDILKRAGLVGGRRRVRRPVDGGRVVTEAVAPNDEWAMDFKGWFRTGDGRRCDPLTVTDQATRYLLEVRIVEPKRVQVQARLERLFQEVGLPRALRSDNGPPFGAPNGGGLSRLSVWLLKLGVEPRHIEPGCPQDNGRHERMHKTLKEETALEPARDKAEQQQRFDAFVTRFNEERPHEALGQRTPCEFWCPSARPMPEKVPEPWYDANHEVRRVRTDGSIKWKDEYVFVSTALAGEPIGLFEVENEARLVRFCGRDLGLIGRDRRFLRFAPPHAAARRSGSGGDNGTNTE